MRGLRTSAIVMASMVMTFVHAQSQEPPQPELGYGSGTFDWSAGASISSFLSSILVVALLCGLVILLVRWVFPPEHRAQAPRPNRAARGDA